ATGDVVFYGKGAGKLPTASAVVADVIDCVKHFKARKYLFWEDAKPGYVEPYENMVEEVFIRAKGNDSDAAFEVVEQVFEGAERLIRREEEEGEIGFTVKDVKVKELEARFARLKELGVEPLNHIKISDF
ncbi:MAG: homoserine dehydrogenase, partial [[Clostridium] leptum]